MQPRIKKTWKQVDGVLLLDKSPGMTSNDALQKARRLFSAAKGGHTGTLDPMATGLLPLCFGEATKFSAALPDADNTYVLNNYAYYLSQRNQQLEKAEKLSKKSNEIGRAHV